MDRTRSASIDLLTDRAEAGERLSERLLHLRGDRPIVLGIPRGGVPIAARIAERLGGTLDLFVVRKVGAPSNPEYGLGAVAEGGYRVLDEARTREAGYALTELEPYVAAEMREVDRRVRTYRGDRPRAEIRDRTVVLVDDGVATGGTVRVAIHALRAKRPRRLVLALGVSPEATCEELQREVDELAVLLRPRWFYAVGQFYEHFEPVSDADVRRLLERGAPARRAVHA